MLKAIRAFLDQHVAPGNQRAGDQSQRLKVAAAVLLVEAARSDHEFSDTERAAILGAVQTRFGLSVDQARELLALAEAQSHDAHDIYQFTAVINAGFSHDQKVHLVEELWRTAGSDQLIRGNEEHLIRRVADLLHLSHSQFIAAKLRAGTSPR
jgi:uncharacterized tellurite resistance protein B-like protein